MCVIMTVIGGSGGHDDRSATVIVRLAQIARSPNKFCQVYLVLIGTCSTAQVDVGARYLNTYFRFWWGR